MIAGEDHVGLLDADGAVEGGGDLVGVGVLVVDRDVLELVADQAARGVDLVDRHPRSLLHLLAVAGDGAAEREDADDLDRALGAAAAGGRGRLGRQRGAGQASDHEPAYGAAGSGQQRPPRDFAFSDLLFGQFLLSL